MKSSRYVRSRRTREKTMKRASILIEQGQMQCGSCEARLHDELAEFCTVCGAVFDTITSSKAGLAARLKRYREAAGVHPYRMHGNQSWMTVRSER